MTLAWWRMSWSTTMTIFRRVLHSIIRSFGTSYQTAVPYSHVHHFCFCPELLFFLPCDCASCEADQWQSFSSSLGFMWNFYPPNVSKCVQMFICQRCPHFQLLHQAGWPKSRAALRRFWSSPSRFSMCGGMVHEWFSTLVRIHLRYLLGLINNQYAICYDRR